MNRLLTLTSGGLFAAMAILPVAAFADTSATPATVTKAPAEVTTPGEHKMGDTKTVAPSSVTSGEAKGHKVETKTEAKGDAVKHDGAVKAPGSQSQGSQSSVQPKPVEPGKS